MKLIKNLLRMFTKSIGAGYERDYNRDLLIKKYGKEEALKKYDELNQK